MLVTLVGQILGCGQCNPWCDDTFNAAKKKNTKINRWRRRSSEMQEEFSVPMLCMAHPSQNSVTFTTQGSQNT